jgi:hypothetical protein
MRKIILLLAAVAVVAALSAYLTRTLAARRDCCAPARSSYEVLNERLNLSDAQRKEVVKLEAEFAVKESVLRAELVAANRDLAKTLASENAYSPKVSAAVERVHVCMGELQKASIAHLYELGGRLDAAQREKLMRYAAVALGDCR